MAMPARSDPQLFSTIAEHAADLLASGPMANIRRPKLPPGSTVLSRRRKRRWRARIRAVAPISPPGGRCADRYRHGRFYADKLRAALLFEIWQQTQLRRQALWRGSLSIRRGAPPGRRWPSEPRRSISGRVLWPGRQTPRPLGRPAGGIERTSRRCGPRWRPGDRRKAMGQGRIAAITCRRGVLRSAAAMLCLAISVPAPHCRFRWW